MISIGNWLDEAADTKEVQQVVELTQTPLPSMSYNQAYDIVEEKYAEQGVDINHIPMEEFSETIEYEILDTMNGGYTPAEIIEMIWIAGMVLLSIGFIATNLHFSWKLRNSRVFLGVTGKLLESDSLELNLNKKRNLLHVYQTDIVETPCLYGVVTPSIYVTKEAMKDKECLRHVLEHESTHYYHIDYIWSVFRVVCLVLHWYNPLVWCAAILSRNDAELACDEATIERLGESERASYGRTLIGLTCEKRPALLLTATTMTGSGKSIRERIALIAKKPKMAIITVIILVLVLQVIIGLTYTGAKLQYANFSEWAETINPEELEYFSLYKGYYPHELHYEPTDEEFAQFCKLLQSIPEEDCYRRKQTVGVYEKYTLFFLCGENEVILKCLEDKTVLYAGSTEMPNFAPEGKVLIIDSPELWNYIVDTVDEKGRISETESKEQGEQFEQSLYEARADLNHDGIDDFVYVMTKALEGRAFQDIEQNGAYIKVFLGEENGSSNLRPVYTSELVTSSHGGNGTYVLSERNGKDYLLYSLMYEQHGSAVYTYQVMYLNGENDMEIIESSDYQFVFSPWHKDWESFSHREDVVPAMKKDLEPWINHATILISFDIQTPTFISTKSVVVPAFTYYDMVWARSDADEIAEFETSIDQERE